MALQFPDLDTIWAQAKALWVAERPNASVAPRSDVWLSSYITAKLWNRLHQTADNVLRAVFPSTTYGVYLDYWLTMLGASDGSGGYGRIIARGSTGGETDVTFTGIGTVTQGDQLTDEDGQVYEFSETYVSAGAETTAVGVQAVDTGSSTNLESGVTLTITAPGGNVNAATTLSTDLDDGADDETDAAGRARLLTLLRRGPSGSWSDWVQIIEAASAGNLDAYVWPKRENQPYGWGFTDYCALQRNETGVAKHIAAGTLYDAIEAAVEAAMPVLLMVNSRELTLTTTSTPVECTITLATGVDSTKECDWDAEDLKTTVTGSNEGAKTVTANDNVHLHLAVDDTVIIDGQTATVAAISVGGDNKVFSVDTWVWGAGSNPTVGTHIMSGGGLIQDCIDAIEDFFDTLGPAKGTYAAPIPGWKDDVRQIDIQTTLINEGDGDIADVTVAAPAVTATPTAGSGATTARLIPGEIVVWEAK